MRIAFTYYPIQNNNALEYLTYTIKNLNRVGIVPVLFSDKNYFINKFTIDWFPIDIDNKYKMNTLWSYPKLKVLSEIHFPFLHLDNDFVVSDYTKLIDKIDLIKLNLGYKHSLNDTQIEPINYIWKKYYLRDTFINELNNTCIIGTTDYKTINVCYKNVLDIIDTYYDFFIERYNGVPPITLNQQYVSTFFKNAINYIQQNNPEFDSLDINGFAHISDKKKYDIFKQSSNII